MSKRQEIFNTVADLVSDFLYYDRKEDDTLQRGEIEEALRSGDVTFDEIVCEFRSHLIMGLRSVLDSRNEPSKDRS